jgi:hypothetical protein
MSMKRQKYYGSRGTESDAAEGFSLDSDKSGESGKTWSQHMEGISDDRFAPYSLKMKFPEGTFLLHSIFGRGIVIKAMPAAIEVLFEGGLKKLAHGKA